MSNGYTDKITPLILHGMIEPEEQLRKQIELFTQLSDEAWQTLLPHLEIKVFSKNDKLISEGQRAYEMGMVVEGMFRQYYIRDGEEKTTYFFFEQHFIGGYISCLSGKPSLLTIEALSEATVVLFPYEVLLGLYQQYPDWQMFGRKIAEYATMGLEERMVSLLTKSAEERYLELLSSNRQKILERIPQQYIANYLGITPESFSRIRHRLAQR